MNYRINAFQMPLSATPSVDKMTVPRNRPVAAVGRGLYPISKSDLDELTPFESYNIDDWDGYGAKPIALETVAAARAFMRLFGREIPQPDIAPGADGTVGFEWRLGLGRVMVDVGPGGRVFARRINQSGEISHFAPTRVETGAKQLVSEIFS